MKYKRGDIVWVGEIKGEVTVSSVQSKNRPAIIIQNDTGNKHSNSTIVVYGTTSIKKEQQPTHTILEGSGLKEPTVFMGEQIDTIPTFCIKERWGRLSSRQMEKIDEIVQISVGDERKKKQLEYEKDVYNVMKQKLGKNELQIYIQTSIIRLSGAISSLPGGQNELLVDFYKEELNKLMEGKYERTNKGS